MVTNFSSKGNIIKSMNVARGLGTRTEAAKEVGEALVKRKLNIMGSLGKSKFGFGSKIL